MVKLIDNISEKFMSAFLISALVWVFCALGIQLFFVYLELSGKTEYQRRVINKIELKFDGRFKDNPENIMYEGPIVKN